MPGLRPSTRPTSADTVAVLGNAGSIQLTPVSLSRAEVTVLDVLARAELGRAAAPDDLPLLDDVVRVGDARQRDQVLADEEDRLAARRQPLDAAPDLGANERRQALRRLVEDQEPRVRHERAPDREHLLLAAREGAAEAPRAGRELGEELEHPGDGPRVRAAAAVRGGRHEVLAHREVREHLAALGHEADPDLGDAVRREPVDRPAVEADPAAPRPPDAHGRAARRLLAPPLPAEQRPPPPPPP